MAKHPHLPLRRLEGALPRRKRTFVPPPPAWTAREHSVKLLAEVDEVVSAVAAETQQGVSPLLIMRVAPTSGTIDEAALARADLQVLSQAADSTAVLFSPDPLLSELRQRATAYGGGTPNGHQGPPNAAFFNSIESFAPVLPKERIGPALLSEGVADLGDLSPDTIYTLDVELWQPSADMEAVFLSRLEKVLSEANGVVLSDYRSPDMLLARVRGDGLAIAAVLRMPEVALVDRPPSIELTPLDAVQLELGDIPAPLGPSDNAHTIGVIDSGITAAHPILEKAVVATFGVPASLGDDDEHGHGTSVAGLAVYGDVAARLESGELSPQFKVASAKVVGSNGDFDDATTLPEVMEEAVRRLATDYGCRVINISLADRYHPVGARPSHWAAVLDTLARELDLVIVVAAGNLSVPVSNRLKSEGLGIYPGYLLEVGNRVLEPAGSVNSLTVGSVAHGNGLQPSDAEFVDIQPLTGEGSPSPFTRSGPGCRDGIKPDLVDRGGTAVWHGGNERLEDARFRNSAGILTLHEDYLSRLFVYRSGTSFAAPLVAYKAALIRETFPDASANMVRALLALCADHPQALITAAAGTKKNELFWLGGYGLADVERALDSEDSRVVLVGEDSLELDRFAVYEIPIPEDFQTIKGRRHIRVSLSYDPPVRRSRKEYVGVKMGFHLVRGASEIEVFDQFRKWEKSEGKPFSLKQSLKCTLKPDATTREAGTLQTATFTANSSLAAYGSKYYLAVRCEGKWAAGVLDEQRFAVAVELWHEAELPLYQALEVPVHA